MVVARWMLLAFCLTSCVDGGLRPIGSPLDEPEPSSCQNGLRDGDESDVDCGGSACGPCTLGARCATINDCAPAAEAAFGPCIGVDNPCALSGMRSRLVTTVRCSEGICAATSEEEREACQRNSAEGEPCAPRIDGEWSACALPSDPQGPICEQDTSERREVTEFFCRAGSCMIETRTESRGCTLAPSQISCDADTVEMWQPCGYTDRCVRSGERGRARSTFVCNDSERCVERERLELEPCERDTQGNGCLGGAMARCVDDVCRWDNAGCNDDIDCDDSDDCTEDLCQQGACIYSPRDVDNDGFSCDVDCDDGNPAVHPFIASSPIPWATMPFRLSSPPRRMSWDYNCDGADDLRYVTFRANCDGASVGQCGGEGWKQPASGELILPACGETATYILCRARNGVCEERPQMRQQLCR